MSQRTLHTLFKPKSITIIGASNTEKRAGNVVIKNLLAGASLDQSCLSPLNMKQ